MHILSQNKIKKYIYLLLGMFCFQIQDKNKV